MKFVKTSLTIALAVWAGWSHAETEYQDVTYRSETLASAARILSLTRLDTLPQGASCLIHGDVMLSLSRQAGRIDHIGRRLFDPRIRQHSPSPVYDYLEYAWLDHTFRLSDNPFLYQNLRFEAGDWQQLELVTDSVPFTVTSTDGNKYRVEWSLPDGRQIVMTFPVGYERLSMSSRRELELNLVADLGRFDPGKAEVPRQGIDTARVVPMDSSVWCEEGASYMIAEINRNRYFTPTAEGGFEPVFDPAHPAESLANLFSWGLLDKPTHGMELTFRLYENRQQQALVSVGQLLGLLHRQGCKVFWGLEDISADEICGTLMAVNEGYGYNHVIAVRCPRQALFADTCVMQASVSLFVPTSTFGNILYQPEGKKKKIIWQ